MIIDQANLKKSSLSSKDRSDYGFTELVLTQEQINSLKSLSTPQLKSMYKAFTECYLTNSDELDLLLVNKCYFEDGQGAEVVKKMYFEKYPNLFGKDDDDENNEIMEHNRVFLANLLAIMPLKSTDFSTTTLERNVDVKNEIYLSLPKRRRLLLQAANEEKEIQFNEASEISQETMKNLKPHPFLTKPYAQFVMVGAIVEKYVPWIYSPCFAKYNNRQAMIAIDREKKENHSSLTVSFEKPILFLSYTQLNGGFYYNYMYDDQFYAPLCELLGYTLANFSIRLTKKSSVAGEKEENRIKWVVLIDNIMFHLHVNEMISGRCYARSIKYINPPKNTPVHKALIQDSAKEGNDELDKFYDEIGLPNTNTSIIDFRSFVKLY